VKTILKLLWLFPLFALAGAPAWALEGAMGIHDPSTVVKCDGNCYVFSTGRGISVLTSSNGFDWHGGGRIFDRIPDSVKSFVPRNDGQSVWAPDIIKLDGQYSKNSKPVPVKFSKAAQEVRKSGFEQVGFPINTALQRGGKGSQSTKPFQRFIAAIPIKPGSR
jgi:hypothetical protein